MKTRFYISFYVDGKGRVGQRQMQELLTAAGCEQLMPEGPFEILGRHTWDFDHTFYEEDPRLIRLREVLKDSGIKPSERREHVYTVSELRAAPLLCLAVNRAPRDTGGPVEESQYDFSRACPECGTGAIQVAPLLVRPGALPAKAPICQTMDDEILVGPALAESLKAERVTGLELRQVCSYKDRKPLDWWQVIARHELPRMARETKGIVQGDPGPCSGCRRDGHYNDGENPMQIVYNCGEVNAHSLPDCVHTWECFGKSGLKEPFKYSHFAAPLLLVKPKVFDIFRSHKVRGVEFIPVEIR